MSELKQSRLETGTLCAEGDWPGVFIRGDNALLLYIPALERVLWRARDSVLSSGTEAPVLTAADFAVVQELLELLADCEVQPGQVVTNDLKSFAEIQK